ncbi:hypothetical protein PVK06_047507 [Gossypium arboreum]|uniref:Uncharacterized protein n=1 Tax=Gossypium arboreum TaxID=29729 RepID=A0ABR0MDT1_GOSAR|nr:hypothetical protein PVK06_047507 [Gossypium arboreum]
MAPQELDDLHCIDLWQPDENWAAFHSQYINMWNNRYNFLTTSEPIIVSELACNPEYMPWFRIHGKPYLYGEEARRRHPHTSRPQHGPLNPKGGEPSPSLAPMQEPVPTTTTSMPKPPSVQYVPSYSGVYPNPYFFTQAQYVAPHFPASTPMLGWTAGHPSPMWYTLGPSHSR